MPLQQPYDRIHDDLPAPVVDIIVKPRPASSRQVSEKVRALLDSGADATMLPESLLARIGAIRIDRRRSRGVYGQARMVSVYLVDIQIGRLVVPLIRAIGLSDNDEPLIGRDVLNHLIVTLDGIGSVTEVS